MKKVRDTQDLILEELMAIKKLLVVSMMAGGVGQEAIGAALGLNKSNVSRMFKKKVGTLTRKGAGV